MNKNLILSVGMPRAGTGWYYNLTQDLVIAGGGVDAKIVRARYGLKHLLTEVNCNIGTLSFYRLIPVSLPILFEPGYVIKLHAERRPLADSLIELDLIKPTFIYRDPRDALLSAYEYGERMRKAGFENAFTPLMTIDDAILFMADYVEIAKGWISSKRTLSLKYEDLIRSYDNEVKRLCDYIQADPESTRIKEVIEKYRPGKKAKHHEGMHFVKGKIGRHKTSFTEIQLAECDRLFRDFLDEYGYSD